MNKTAETSAELIRFDFRTRAVLAAMCLLFLIATALEVHTSSLGYWTSILRDGEPAPILIGTPHEVRSDEWRGMTPMILSQYKLGFPMLNPSIGGGATPLFASLPVRHWAMFVRPQFWGFFTIGVQRGFAFYWDSKALGLCVGMFLLLMLLTNNHFGVSLLGAGWALFSGFTQWWYGSALLLETGCLALLIVAAHYMLLSPSRRAIAVASIVFAVSALNFGLTFYPPFTLPLFYLGIAILAGSLLPRLMTGAFRKHLGFRALCTSLTFVGIAVFLFLYYRDVKSALDLINATAYPGSRVIEGGAVPLTKLFNGFFGVFFTEERFPAVWGNVCESSNYVLFFPVVAGAVLWRTVRRKGVSALEWTLLLYIALMVAWCMVGFPRWFADPTAFSFIPEARTFLGIGLASVILCCVFLAKSQIDIPRHIAGRIVIGAVILAAIILFARRFNPYTDHFASKAEVNTVCIVVTIAGYSLLARKRAIFALAVLPPLVWAHAAVNPVTIGLGSLVNSPTLQKVAQIAAQDPGARWAIYDSYTLPDAFRTAGAQVFNGVKVTPQLDQLRVFDPTGANDSTYNRLGYFHLVPVQDQNASYLLERGDLFTLKIDPKSDLWRRIGVRYIGLQSKSTDPEFLAKTELIVESPAAEIWVYRYRQ